MNELEIVTMFLVIVDVVMYVFTPSEFRWGLPWWRYLPLGGVVGYVQWNIAEKENDGA